MTFLELIFEPLRRRFPGRTKEDYDAELRLIEKIGKARERVMNMYFEELQRRLNQAADTAREERDREIKDKLLSQGHGGGNWRRLTEQLLTPTPPTKQ
jgi:hypothetical protein